MVGVLDLDQLEAVLSVIAPSPPHYYNYILFSKKPMDMKRIPMKGGRPGVGVTKRSRASNVIPELAEDSMYGYVSYLEM